MHFAWEVKNNVSFEQVVMHIEQGDLLDIIKHPNNAKYAHQKVLVVMIKNYVYAVPFVEEDVNTRFLKTIIPSRKLTKKYLGAIMKEYKLDKEEQALLESIENDEWVSVDNLQNEINQHQEIAKNTLKKDKRINIRLSSFDLEALKTSAVEMGLPYQTLISSILHQYVSGRLVPSDDSKQH